MGRKLSTYEATDGKGYCEVHFDFREEYAYIKYYDDNGKKFYTEDHHNKKIDDVFSHARKWAEGYEKIEKDLY